MADFVASQYAIDELETFIKSYVDQKSNNKGLPIRNVSSIGVSTTAVTVLDIASDGGGDLYLVSTSSYSGTSNYPQSLRVTIDDEIVVDLKWRTGTKKAVGLADFLTQYYDTSIKWYTFAPSSINNITLVGTYSSHFFLDLKNSADADEFHIIPTPLHFKSSLKIEVLPYSSSHGTSQSYVMAVYSLNE